MLGSDREFARDYAMISREYGIHLHDTRAYIRPEWKQDIRLAEDAQPQLVTLSNAGIPSFLTTMVDPQVFQVLLTPNKAATIFGEAKKGTWLDQTAMFPILERTGEVSTYGDFNNNGRAGLNINFPQRQSYLFQCIVEYGELEMERMGLARVSWAAGLQEAAATVLDKFMNFSYFFGVLGLQNYGLLNDPSLAPPLTPITKAAGGTQWINADHQVVATANEIYMDIQTLIAYLVENSGGLIGIEDDFVLAMSPASSVALTSTNQSGINVGDLLQKNFPNLRIETAVQYAQTSPQNPEGLEAGSMMQIICGRVEGQDTGYCSFTEKLRTHAVVRDLSSFKQKYTSGTWGCVIRQPFCIAAMVGI
jgi:hypothetical protein